jgi:hypothetical protein
LAWPTPPFVFAPTGLERSVEKAGVRGARRSRCPEEAQKRGRGWVGECRSRRPLRTAQRWEGNPHSLAEARRCTGRSDPGVAGVGARRLGGNWEASPWVWILSENVQRGFDLVRVGGQGSDTLVTWFFFPNCMIRGPLQAGPGGSGGRLSGPGRPDRTTDPRNGCLCGISVTRLEIQVGLQTFDYVGDLRDWPGVQGTLSGKGSPDKRQRFRDDTFDTAAKCQYRVPNCCRGGP